MLQMCDPSFIEEAIKRAEAAGLYPADGQRAVDWEEVRIWADRVQQVGFQWLTADEQPPYGGGDIIVAANGAICSGQHRILGGLMGDNPVPETSISRLTVEVPKREWR
jgi:hypothetical protein